MLGLDLWSASDEHSSWYRNWGQVNQTEQSNASSRDALQDKTFHLRVTKWLRRLHSFTDDGKRVSLRTLVIQTDVPKALEEYSKIAVTVGARDIGSADKVGHVSDFKDVGGGLEILLHPPTAMFNDLLSCLRDNLNLDDTHQVMIHVTTKTRLEDWIPKGKDVAVVAFTFTNAEGKYEP